VLLIQMGSGDGSHASRTGLVDVLEEDFPLEKPCFGMARRVPLYCRSRAGARGGGHLDALTRAPLPSLLRRCRRQFDTLVIDGPAVEAAPALRSLAKLADAVLMIVDESRARRIASLRRSRFRSAEAVRRLQQG